MSPGPNQSPSPLRWEQVPLQWSWDSDMGGGEEEGKKKTSGVAGEKGEVQRSGKDERPSLITSGPGTEPRPDPQDRQRGGSGRLGGPEDPCFNFNPDLKPQRCLGYYATRVDIARSFCITLRYKKTEAFIRCKWKWAVHYYTSRPWNRSAFQSVYSSRQSQSFRR